MSYEGRILLMCENGHVKYADPYMEYFEDLGLEGKESKNTCLYCGTQFKKIGHIDDTNGDSVASFFLKELTKEEFDIKIDTENMSSVTYHKPATYEVVHTDYWVNFDTGEKLSNW